MYEVKADALESSFETVERNGDVAALREEVSGLKRRLDQALVAGGRPVLGEAKADDARPEVKAFVDRYLRKGLEQGVEPLRQGIVRLVAHMHLHRDGDQSPPAAVAALWRPWRRMRLK